MTWNDCRYNAPDIGTLIMARWFDAIADVWRYQGGEVRLSSMGATIYDHNGMALYLCEIFEWKEVDRGVE